MLGEKKIKLEPDAVYKINIWFWKFTDFFWNPRKYLKRIPLKEGMVVVDYGCGPGRYALPVAESIGQKGKVFAVDIHPLAIKTVKKKAAQKSLTNIEAILVDSYNTSLKSSIADLVLLVDTLHLINNSYALFGEIYRILKRDGILFMDSGHLKKVKAKEIMENTGLFTIVKCRGNDMLISTKNK